MQEEHLGQGEKFEFYFDYTRKPLGVYWMCVGGRRSIEVLSSGMGYDLSLWLICEDVLMGTKTY